MGVVGVAGISSGRESVSRVPKVQQERRSGRESTVGRGKGCSGGQEELMTSSWLDGVENSDVVEERWRV